MGPPFVRIINFFIIFRQRIFIHRTCMRCLPGYILWEHTIFIMVKQSTVIFSQHFGKSHRTSFPISKPLQSSIRDHCLNNDHPMRMSNFNILV